MTYHFSTTVEKSFNEAVVATKEALKTTPFSSAYGDQYEG